MFDDPQPRKLQGQVVLARVNFMRSTQEFASRPNALTWDDVLASKVRLERAVKRIDDYVATMTDEEVLDSLDEQQKRLLQHD